MAHQLPQASAALSAVLNAECANGFGFQYREETGILILVFMTGEVLPDQDPSRILPDRYPLPDTVSIREGADCTSVQRGNWLGREYLEVHWSEWDRIPIVLQWLLDHHVNIQWRPNFQAYFPAGSRFSWDEAERRWVESNDHDTTLKDMWLLKLVHRTALEPYNWHTEIGRQWCSRARTRLNLSPVSDHTQDNRFTWNGYNIAAAESGVYHFGGWSNADVSRCATPKKVLETKVAPDMPTQTMCVVCLETAGDTLVLDCGHVSVCRACSLKLKDTPDAKVCVQCRQPIVEVLMDE
ncbi:MAG: RING-HC finger protein [Nitrospinaceae bacterium]|nr:RING-HC finger protein [Nitrospinaceae bacterium]